MRWSTLFIPTLRDAPGDAEAASHQLLIRGGFIRQLHAGHYTLLPLGLRVREKVARIIRQEMDAIGGQEMQMPTMHPATIWRQSGRWESMGDVMFRLQDRHGVDTALGVTAEEIFTTHATELSSYRQLPQIWYQIHTKFRDEARPKSGLLRVREFAMKDSYSFDIDEEGLDRSFDLHHGAYTRIYQRLGLDAVPVEASSGNMGGSDSVEFMVPASVGEDDVVRCPSCGYAANVEKATSALPAIDDPEGLPEPERFPTPGVRTIAALEEIEGGAPANCQIKTLVFMIDGALTLALVRGDHQLNEQKLADATGAVAVRPAAADEIHAALGAHPGSLGAVGLSGLRILADPALAGRRAMTTGANDDDWHLRGVEVERDIIVDEWVDLRQVEAGEACPNCGTGVEVVPAVEVGHIFKLGRKYAETFGVDVLDENSETRTVIMGSYGIGIDRGIAIIAETHNDEKGLVWPVSVAPYEVVITVMRLDDEVLQAAEGIYQELRKQGIDVLLDDRDARPGVKFADAELIGVPWRITVGPKGLANGSVELTERAGMETVDTPLGDIVDTVAAKVIEAR
ncbi:MAG: proline--tRNA ligase [Actinomycetia bacterium]|nr:proline--tRNA ligase [Actinomycetes bacterium]